MNPYINIWLRPTSTIRFVLDRKIKFIPVLPLVITSLAVAWSILTHTTNTFMIFVFLVFATLTTYAIMAYLLPELVTKFGKVWHGIGTFKSIQLVFALSGIPILLIFVIQILGFLVPEVKEAAEINYTIKILAGILCVRNLIIGISIAQGFTYTQSLLNLVVSLLPLLLVRLAMM